MIASLSRLTWTCGAVVCSYLHMLEPSDLLTDEEVDRLSDFLNSVDTAMNLEEFDGFVCAVVSGPDLITPSEFWPIAAGYDPAETDVFSTPEEMKEIFDLVIRHWNAIATRLFADEPYCPVLFKDDAGQVNGTEWAQGFLEGVRLRQESWSALFEDDDHVDAILPILALAHRDHPDPSMRLKFPVPQKREEVLGLLTEGLLRIYQYFLERRAEPAAVPTTVRRAQPKVGRNEPCPCGSGEKYKNCCLRKAH